RPRDDVSNHRDVFRSVRMAMADLAGFGRRELHQVRTAGHHALSQFEPVEDLNPVAVAGAGAHGAALKRLASGLYEHDGDAAFVHHRLRWDRKPGLRVADEDARLDGRADLQPGMRRRDLVRVVESTSAPAPISRAFLPVTTSKL